MLNKNLSEGILAAALNPTEHMVLPKPKSVVPPFDFGPIKNAAAKIKKSAADYGAALSAALLIVGVFRAQAGAESQFLPLPAL